MSKVCVLTSGEGEYGIDACIKQLLEGASGLDAIEAGIQLVESDPRAYTVGYNGAPNILGEMECDASIMCGKNRLTAAVAGVKNYKHPISIAKSLYGKMPHVLLSGVGANTFAKEIGAEPAEMLSPEAKQRYEEWLSKNIAPKQGGSLSDLPLSSYISFNTRDDLSRGTVTFLAIDNHGDIWGGVSTSGWAYCYPGRMGDSSIIGAGLYVDNRYGAASCTHTGEMTIRGLTAFSTVNYLRTGCSAQEACHRALEDLTTLQDGYLGPLIVHALTPNGDHAVMALLDREDEYWFWDQSLSKAIRRYPIPFENK